MTDSGSYKVGSRFEHSRFIIGSPKAGTARPDVCTITKIASGNVYYRNESGMLFSAVRERFDGPNGAVKNWLTESGSVVEPRVVRRAEVQRTVFPFLGGLEFAVECLTKELANSVVWHLSSCEAYKGVHHFAVIGEGRTVAFSASGRDCLVAAGLLPAEG